MPSPISLDPRKRLAEITRESVTIDLVRALKDRFEVVRAQVIVHYPADRAHRAHRPDIADRVIEVLRVAVGNVQPSVVLAIQVELHHQLASRVA